MKLSIFSLFSQCTLAMSTASNMMKGTCFTASECAANGGTSSGNCASGNISIWIKVLSFNILVFLTFL